MVVIIIIWINIFNLFSSTPIFIVKLMISIEKYDIELAKIDFYIFERYFLLYNILIYE